MPVPGAGRPGSTEWSNDIHDVCNEDSELAVLRREFQAEVQKLAARLTLMEHQLSQVLPAPVETTEMTEVEAVDVTSTWKGNEETRVKDVKVEMESVAPTSAAPTVGFHPESDVAFEESAWTYPVVIGLADVTWVDATFAIIILLLNLCMQLIFSGIILGPDFLGEEFVTKIDVASRWRTSFAHDHKYLDLSSTSLVTRVCSADGSLILASSQATMVNHINSYMGLLKDQFEAGFYQPGILLCMLCILLWALCVYKEVRKTWLALEATAKLPRSKRTIFRDNAIESISKGRLIALLFTYVTRFIIAWVLLTAGVRWLARTTSITELMLNAVALNAILDVDEFLFAGFTPVSLQVAIRHLEPMKVRYTSRRSKIESVVLFFLLVGTFLVPYFVFLQPLGETMIAVKRELCYGNQTFVVGENTQTQVILGFTTAVERSSDLSVMERAVREHKFSKDPSYVPLIYFTTEQEFERERTISMAAETADFGLCIEKEITQPGGSFYQDPVLTAMVAPRFRSAAASLGVFDAETCEDLRSYCDDRDSRQLRLVCGDTCGCTDPFAFNWFRVPAYGCNDACSQVAQQSVNGNCQDVPADERWHALWDAYFPAINAFVGGNLQGSESLLQSIQQAVSAIKRGGCSVLADPRLGVEGNEETRVKDVKVEMESVAPSAAPTVGFHPESDVEFEESAWTYPVVIGLADITWVDASFAIIILLLNLCMQLIFSGIILGPDFLGEEFVTKIDVASRWRTSFAHDHKYTDLSSTSLVTRVCSADGSLILATTQATMVNHINSYMGLLKDQFEAGFYQPGILLCMLCILLWTLCVYKEVRKTWLALEATAKLPRSNRTIFRDNAIETISKVRFIALMFTYITRFVIAWVLLTAGVRWLARTTSITELMLNAVALNAILDVDEFLFAGFTPVSLQVAIRHLEPMKVRYTARRSQRESVILFFLLVGTFLLPYFVFLRPLGETMMAVKRELCYGNQTFVVGENTQTQVILGFTTAFERSSELSVMERAVRDHKFTTGDASYVPLIYFTPEQDFERERTLSMVEEAADFGFCMEKEITQPGGSFYQDPVLLGVMNPRLRMAGANVGVFDVQSCEDLRSHCEGKDSRQLRLVCGDTCGCTDPFAFNWFRVPAYGCNDACTQIALQAVSGNCQDVPADDRWHALWDAYLPSLSAYVGGNLADSSSLFQQIQQVVEALKRGGCSVLADPRMGTEIGSSRRWCDGNPDFYKPFAWKCPVACGCTGPNPPSNCPTCSSTSA